MIEWKTWREWPNWAKKLVYKLNLVQYSTRRIKFNHPFVTAWYKLAYQFYKRGMLLLEEGTMVPVNWPLKIKWITKF